MSLIANDILTWMEHRIFCEDVVDGTLPADVGPGAQTVAFTSESLFAGAQLMVGGANPEIVTVSDYSAGNMSITFANAHAAGTSIGAATFPRGQPIDPLFWQSEMIEYLAGITNDFMLKTWPIYAIVQNAVMTGIRYFTTPADAIRVERMSRINSMNPMSVARMYNVSVSDLDMMDPNWAADRGHPKNYYEDQLNTGQYGIYPLPSISFLTWVWYSQRAIQPDQWTLATPIPIPDPMAYILYYGVLGRVFGKDGEMRDAGREQYCYTRYHQGIEIVVRLLEGIQAWMQPGPVQSKGAAPPPR